MSRKQMHTPFTILAPGKKEKGITVKNKKRKIEQLKDIKHANNTLNKAHLNETLNCSAKVHTEQNVDNTIDNILQVHQPPNGAKTTTTVSTFTKQGLLKQAKEYVPPKPLHIPPGTITNWAQLTRINTEHNATTAKYIPEKAETLRVKRSIRWAPDVKPPAAAYALSKKKRSKNKKAARRKQGTKKRKGRW